MSGSGEPWFVGFDAASGTLLLPVWSAAVVAALFVAQCVFVLSRVGRDSLLEAMARGGLLLVGGAVVWVVLDTSAAGNLAAQRRALDARLSEMTTRAVAPGSALACLGGAAGDLVEAACEKALFASPETAAASVAYVAAQLSLLADGNDYERRSGASYESALGALRHAVEADRFGLVAHVLADRDGCTADRCAAFALLRDTSQIADNINGHKYESYIVHHALEWPQSSLSPVAAATSVPSAATASSPTAPPSAAPATAASAAKPNGLFFPSSASIPPVSIMSAEPPGAPPAGGEVAKPPASADKPPASGDKSPASGDKPAATAAHKPAPQQPARRPTNPTNLAPPARAAGTGEPPANQ